MEDNRLRIYKVENGWLIEKKEGDFTVSHMQTQVIVFTEIEDMLEWIRKFYECDDGVK